MAGRKFKEGDIVRIFPSVAKKCLDSRGLNVIPYSGIVQEYKEGGIYYISDVSCQLPTNPSNPGERKLFRLSRQSGIVILGLRASELELETDETILSALSHPDEVPTAIGKYLISGNLTGGGEYRLQSINEVGIQNSRILADCTYLYMNIKSTKVYSVLGKFKEKKLDNIINLWKVRDRYYQYTWTFIENGQFVVDLADVQYVFDWEKEHQDFIVAGEVL